MPRDRLHFGPFSFDPVALELRRRGRRLRLRPQSASALDLLLTNPGREVSRQALREVLWGEVEYLDHETGINSCIRRLRRVLGDRASRPRYILTLPGRGYRFIAPVSAVSDAAPSDAARRSQRAAPIEAGTTVDGEAEESVSGPGENVREGAPPRPRRGRRSLTTLVLTLLAAGSLWAGRSANPWSEVPREEGLDLVLGSDLVRSGLDADLARSLADAFRIGLERAPQVRLLPRRRARLALARMQRGADSAIDRDVGMEIAQREGLDGIVVLRIQLPGGPLQLQAEVTAAADGATLASASSRVDGESEALAGLDDLLIRLAAALEDLPGPLAPRPFPLAEVTTSDLEALRAYSLGVRRAVAGRVDVATRLFERALELDPGFVMARVKLGISQRNTGNFASAIGQFRFARQSAGRLTEFERLYVEGWLGWLRLAPGKSIGAWTLLRELYPRRTIGYHNLAVAQASLRLDFDRCAATARAGLRIAEVARSVRTLEIVLRHCQLGGGKVDEALSGVLPHLREPGIYTELIPYVLIAARRYDALAANLADWERDRISDRRGVWNAARSLRLRSIQLADSGRFEAAAELVRRAEAIEAPGASEHQVWSRLAYLAYRLEQKDRPPAPGELADSIELVERLLAGAEAEACRPHRAQVLGLLGRAAARSGHLELARAVLARIDRSQDLLHEGLWGAHLALVVAEIQAAEGDFEGARTRLQAALVKSPVAPLHAHESLAAWLWTTGRPRAALELDRWIVERRGRALAECTGILSCFDRPFNVVAWGRANRRLEGAAAALLTRAWSGRGGEPVTAP